MKLLKKLVDYPVLIAIIMLKDFVEIFKYLILIKMPINVLTFTENMPISWWDFSIKLIISILLWVVLKAYVKLKNDFDKRTIYFDNRMTVFNLITTERNRASFIRLYSSVKHLQLPNESNEDYWKRLPSGGLYQQNYYQEYEYIKGQLITMMPDKTILEIENLLSNFYTINNK
ncbi:MAG: hypothetical protein QM541_12365 [Flavobacterium sp.]|nr:hypothetical protein [Flavobacterium sp.]